MKSGKLKMIAILLLCAVLLSGCDIRNYFYTEDGLKRVAEKSLKKKYGEDFVVYRAWDRSQELFFADCSPKDNPDVVFQADIYKNGSGIYADGYSQAVISKEVDDILGGSFREVFGNCYTVGEVLYYYKQPKFENPKEVTIEEYLEQSDIGFMIYYVFVEKTDVSEKDVEKEYQFLSEELVQNVSDNIRQEEVKNLIVVLYFVDEQMLKECQNFFSTNANVKGEFSPKLSEYWDNEVNCNYKSGNIDKSYEEYKKVRLQLETEDK